MKYHEDGTSCGLDKIFVFGSNLSGVHGAGAARYAHQQRNFPWGQGEGLELLSMCYAIPTKDENIQTMSLEAIDSAILRMAKTLQYVHDPVSFTRFGCVLAGYSDSDIAPRLRTALEVYGIPASRLDLPSDWKPYFEGYDIQ